jgi:quinone-modifying oxidoreductase, subunit QmoC
MASDGNPPADPPRPAERLRPDRELLSRVLGNGGEDLRKCMQCATCSAVCELADGHNPSPRKEMLWAQWGLRQRLMADPDIWLCHQCNDCTLRCPRGARPGDVMAALRRECVTHYSAPGPIGRWASRPSSLFWIVLVSAAVLAAAASAWQWAGLTKAELTSTGPRIVFPFWTRFPHGLLMAGGSLLLIADAVKLFVSGRRYWRDLTAAGALPIARHRSSLRAALLRIIWHDDFSLCAANNSRRTSHVLVLYGMLALFLTDLWVITARFNPLLTGLVYPLGFLNPWKIMANLAGLAVLIGATLMSVERWRRPQTAGSGSYSDWALLGFLILIVLTGFGSELLHYASLDSLRYAVYAAHLVTVLAFLWMLPYSKLAHVVFRTVAMVYAERTGRRAFRQPAEDPVQAGAAK